MLSTVKDWLRPSWHQMRASTLPVRRLVAAQLSRLPINSEVIGPPKGYYPTTQEWLATVDGKTSASNYCSVHPEHLIHRVLPRTVNTSIEWIFRNRLELEAPETFVVSLNKGRVWGTNGAVITTNDKLLADVSSEAGRPPQEHSVFRMWKLPPVRELAGSAAVIATIGSSDMYYHWMFDALPRIEILRRATIDLQSIDHFIVSRCRFPFHRETLSTLGINSSSIIESSPSLHLRVEQLIVPSLPGKMGITPKWICDFLRMTFLTQCSSRSVGLPERIYIGRGDATHRKVINEAEVVEYLERFGFVKVTAGTMSVTEQVALFSAANVIVAPHGGGLSNLVFCSPGTKVIECFAPTYVRACFWALSNQLGLEHYYLLGEGESPPEGILLEQSTDNIVIDIKKLAATLQLAGFC